MSTGVTLTAEGITKRYSGAPLFSPVSFEASSSEIVAITGSNGTGKSTLLKILAKVLSPTKGTVSFQQTGASLSEDVYQSHIGFAAPYLELYSELTAIEHIQFVGELKGKALDLQECITQLTSLGLDEKIAASDRHVKQYSSGMQQRVKLAMAFALSPDFIFLDEPGSNLDADGITLLFDTIKKKASDGALVLIATNDAAEVNLAGRTIKLEAHRKGTV
jgi:ABC-type multidrug transport system ATPase subunit